MFYHNPGNPYKFLKQTNLTKINTNVKKLLSEISKIVKNALIISLDPPYLLYY